MDKNKYMTPQTIWEKVSSYFVNRVEEVFYNLGVTVAANPIRTIIITILFIGLSSIGLLRFYIEKDPMKLWVPPESDFFIDTEWFIDKFESGFRVQNVLVTADNVLEPEILLKLNDIAKKISSIDAKLGNESYNINDLCFKVPVIKSLSGSVNIFEEQEDISLILNSDVYCDIVSGFKTDCYQQNILDIWSFNSTIISDLSKEDILYSISNVSMSPSTGHHVNFSRLLGGVKLNERGYIVSASSVMMTWFTYVNFSAVDLDEVGNLVGTEDWVSKPLLAWEYSFMNLMKQLSHNMTGLNIYYEAGRSFGDVTGDTMFQDIDKLFIGIAIMFIYIQFVMSRCNWLEVRITLGSVGLLCVGMAYLATCSWCSILSVPFGPVHSSLPFLLMGLGIDDMFVMKACWEQLTEDELKKSLPIKIGLMLKHAGVSIVITSFTDIVALLIGAITILPSLKSFCFYAAMGVFFIFCFSVTFYVAVFTLDIKRVESNRNGILFCYKHREIIQLSHEQTLFQRYFSSVYEKFIFTFPAKIFVVFATVIVTLFSVQALFNLEQRFDPSWFVPDKTYYKDYLNKHEFYYPNTGHIAMVFIGEMNYHQEFPKLYYLTQRIRQEMYVNDLTTWVESYHAYMLRNFRIDLRNQSIKNHDFYNYLSKFLFSPSGGRFQINVKFSAPLVCGKIAPNITASNMQFRFARFNGPKEYIPAMNKIKHIVKSANFTSGDGYRSVWSKVFANWATDEIIAVEVERNIELALACVMGCTIILITNLQMCLWIFICVLLTLVNVLGCMQRWGMTVDIVCCIGLELAIGLCVDYAAHIGHTFLTISQGTRSERSLKTVTSIGSAVLFGGGSMLLSLSLLSMSEAYTFKSFFKIFILVIFFGLYHGLVFLPVILSFIGPQAYHDNHSNCNENAEKEIVELNGKLNEDDI